MKTKRLHARLLLLGFAPLLTAGCDQALSKEAGSAGAVPLTDDIARASYVIGYQQAKSIEAQTQGVLNLKAFADGVSDASVDAASKVPPAESDNLMQAMTAAINVKQSEASAGIRTAGVKLMEENKAKPGVTTLASGMQYEVLQEGSGPKPGPTDRVVTHYHGTLPDGKVFDSSVERGQPATFGVNQVISGWTEALQLMGVGAKWRLVIPPELAYGDRGAGADIPPGATLIFEVELLEIK